MIDFTKYKTKRKAYGGANGNKISIIYDNSVYMLKLPTHAIKNRNLSYANSAVSEYLGCHIFNMLGVCAQETLLGTYTYHDKERIVVACKDFVKSSYQLLDFAAIKNQIIDSNSNGYGTDIDDILETIDKQTVIDHLVLKKHFWKIFVIDALIGNWDRHNGNWGFLYHNDTDMVTLAPVYDCGSCLFPQIDEGLIIRALNNKKELESRVYEVPTSAIQHNGKRINYYDLLSSHEYKECDEAINEISKLVNLDDISKLIDTVQCISENHKLFLKEIISLRFKKLIVENLK